MKIVESGLLTTVQDLGRPGYQKDGVTLGGAMDRLALRIANRLVGNEDGAAALETTLRGPRIEFDAETLIAICGGDHSPKISDISIPGWRALCVQAGTSLNFGAPGWGSRAYLAVAGGIQVPPVLGSRSTYLRAQIGGLEGRALRAGDELEVGAPGDSARRIMREASNTGPMSFVLTARRLRSEVARSIYDQSVVRVVPGCESDHFEEGTRAAFFDTTFQISPSSDRMGYRLGGKTIEAGDRGEMLSRPVAIGSIQVPGGGEPILLMADRQTTGGYPVISNVISADLHLVAQRKPGDKIRFEEVTVEEAQKALRDLESKIDELTREFDLGVD